MQRVQIGFLVPSKAAANRRRKPTVARGAALTATEMGQGTPSWA
jgi:hypothetical protein